MRFIDENSEYTTTTLRRSIFLILLLAALVFQLGCGKSSDTVTVTISPTTATVPLGATQQFAAVVTGNSNTSVTWSVNSVTGGNSTVGTISTTGLYTAPTNAMNSSSVSVTATSAADTSKSASATVTINSGAKVTVYPTEGVTLAAGETYQFTDTVKNTSNPDQSTAVYWYVNNVQGGSSTVGTITTTGFYTAPAQVGTSTTYVVTAKLQADATSYGTTNVTIVPAGAPTLSTLNPSTVAQGSAFEDVYLSGANFMSTSIARVNGVQVPTSYITTNVLRARIPADDLASAATLYIDVEQPSGALSSAVRLNVVATPSALISTSPDSTPQNGGALGVTFNGGYYSSATTAQFNGKVRSATVQNPRQLNVGINSSDVNAAGLFSVSVRNSGVPSHISAANLAVASAESPTILTTLGVGPTPMSVAINPVTGVAVVANSGTGANGNSISLISVDPNSANYLQQIGSPVTVGTSPTGVAIDNVRNYAVVTNNGDNSVSVVDLSTTPPVVKATITDQIDVKPFAVGVNSLTGQALVVYQNSATATIIDLSTLIVSATGAIPTTGAAPQVAIDQRLNWGLVTPGGTGALSVVDMARGGRKVVSMIAVPSSNGAKRASGTVTITTTSDHSLVIGQKVVISGVDDASFNGTFAVASVPSTTTFTYTQAGSDTTSGNGMVSGAAPLVTISLNQNVRGIGLNAETEQAVLADPSSTSITVLSLLDQSIETMALEVGTTASAVNSLTDTAVVVNQQANQASVIDIRNKRRSAQFTVGTKPTAVAIDPVTNIAVVVNQSGNTVTLIQLGTIRPLHITQLSQYSTLTSTSNQTLTVVGNGFTAGSVVRFNETSLVTTYVSPRVLTANVPSSMLASPQRYVVDVLNTDGTQSNVSDYTVIQAIAVGTSPHAVAIDRQRNLAVVSNSGSKNVSIINLGSLSISGTLKVGTSPQGVAVCSVAGRAVVTNRDDDTVSIIDLDNMAVSSTVSVAPTSGTSKPLGVAIHPASGTAIVTNSNSSNVAFFNVTNPGTPSTLSVDVGPNAVAVDPTRNIAAVTETESGQVVFIDLSTQQILDRISGFQLPTGAVYDPDSDSFLVTSSLANNIGYVIAHPEDSNYTLSYNRMGINPTSIDSNYRSSTIVTTNTASQTMSVMDSLAKTVKAIIPISVSQQFGVAIDPVTNRAIVVDQANNRVLVVPLPK